MVVVGQADAPDVVAVAVGVVETAEDEPVLHGAHLREPVLVHGGEGVPLGALGRRAVRPAGAYGVKPVLDLCAHGVQTAVSAVDRMLFFADL